MTTIKSYDKHFLPKLEIVPADQASANTAWVQPFADGYGANRAHYMLIIGNVGTDNITAAVFQATDADGTDSKAVTSASITAVTSASAGEIITIEISPDALDNLNGFTWVRLVVTVASSGTEPYTVVYNRYDLRNVGNTPQHATYTQIIRVPNA